MYIHFIEIRWQKIAKLFNNPEQIKNRYNISSNIETKIIRLIISSVEEDLAKWTVICYWWRCESQASFKSKFSKFLNDCKYLFRNSASAYLSEKNTVTY